MKSTWRSVAAVVAVLLVSGCTQTISGTGTLAPNAGRVPAIKRALFDGTALAKLLDQPFQPYPHYSEFGAATNWEPRGIRRSPPSASASSI